MDEEMGSKVLPAICQRVVLAEAIMHGLTIAEYAPSSTAHEEFAALAKAVTSLLEDPERARVLASQARREVEKYTWPRVREQWAAVYCGR